MYIIRSKLLNFLWKFPIQFQELEIDIPLLRFYIPKYIPTQLEYYAEIRKDLNKVGKKHFVNIPHEPFLKGRRFLEQTLGFNYLA